MGCEPLGRIQYSLRTERSSEHSACTIGKREVQTHTTLGSSRWRRTWHELRLTVIVRGRLCGGAGAFSRMVRESATPVPGAGICPPESSPGQRNISGSLASILRRPSHLSNYFWKRFIRKIDYL